MQFKIDYESGKIKEKSEISKDRLIAFEPPEGYHLAFSGGKDSQTIYLLAKLSGVKFDAHYARVTVDPPELIYFIRKNFPDVNIIEPEMTMWNLIPYKKSPPTRISRYCCSVLKEEGGIGRFVITGVRHEESGKRSKRKFVEYDVYGSESKLAKSDREKFNLMNDNHEKRRMIEHCSIKGKNILNPIIDWTLREVWQFLKESGEEYCKLYDEGWERIGCIGCPMAGDGRINQFLRYPTFYISYIHSFDRMIEERLKNDMDTQWENGLQVMQWWLEMNDQEFKIIDKKIKDNYLKQKKKSYGNNQAIMKHVYKNIKK